MPEGVIQTQENYYRCDCGIKGWAIIFLEGGYEKLSSAIFFFNLCTSANILFSKCKLIFLHLSCLQAVYFVFLGSANNFFQYFSYPLSRKIMVHP